MTESIEGNDSLLLKEVFPITLATRMEPEPEHVVSSISLASYVRLIRVNKNLRRLWLAQIVSEIGDWLYTLSIYTLLLQLRETRLRWRWRWSCRYYHKHSLGRRLG